MDEPNPHSDKEWVEHWRRLGPILEEIRIEELRHFNYEEQLPIIGALLQLGVDHAVPRPTSGLVEFQRLLAKSKKPDMETITFTLPEPMSRKLKELAREANVSAEELVRASVEEWLQRLNDDFARAAAYVLQKNVALHRRLADAEDGRINEAE
jgi:Arc/MetJ-type ribon-helix-helix transcriptional regulator